MIRAAHARLAAAVVAASFLAGAIVPSAAADLGATPSSIWLGHFSGGRNLKPGADPIPLDWVDVKQRFASRGACVSWQRDMQRAYPTDEGWKTCLLIR